MAWSGIGDDHGCNQVKNVDGCTTLFVDNVPKAMTMQWLQQIFTHQGNLVDVVLSCKVWKTTNNMLGFVRYGCHEEPLKVKKKNEWGND